MSARPAGLATVAATLAGLTLAAPAGATAGPALTAPHAMLVQPQTGDVLVRRGADEARPVASATKLMTALVVLEQTSLDDVFAAVPYQAAAAESRIDLRAGERMTVRDLLRALLLESANDAAVTLAVGSLGSVGAFVAEMNERARTLGLRSTSFTNPIGLDEPGNRSSAADLVRLTLRLRGHRFFRATVSRPAIRIASGGRPRLLENTNELVGLPPGVDGVKTGHTLGAGYVLVGSASRRGVDVVSVVLGEPSEAARDADTLALLRWGLGRYRRVAIVRPDRVAATARVRHREEDRVELVPARRIERVLRRGERPAIALRAQDELEGPLPRGTVAGSLTVRLRGRTIARVPLVTAQPVPEVTTIERVAGFVLRPGTLAVGFVVLAGGTLAAVAIRRRRVPTS